MSEDNQEKSYAKAQDFERDPKVVEILSFDRKQGGKYVDKWGFSNALTFRYNGEEQVLTSSSYGFYKSFKESGLRSGDTAMMVTIGFQNPSDERQYRWWIFQKLETTVSSSQPSLDIPM